MRIRRRNTNGQSRPQRGGFTLIELLVVISIIATLMALILPAIQNARENARRMECQNNLRNLAVAMAGFASAHKDRLPAAGYWIDEDTTDTALTVVPGRSWVVEMLPYLDSKNIYDRWNKSVAFYHAGTLPPGATPYQSASDTNLEISVTTSLDVLACPNDETAFKQDGGLSYVVNGGYGNQNFPAMFDQTNPITFHHSSVLPVDWNGNSTVGDAQDIEVTQGTAVFWSEYPGLTSGGRSLSKIYDGTANTIMMAENTRAGIDLNASNPSAVSSFSSPWLYSSTFVVPIEPASNDGSTYTAPVTSLPNARINDSVNLSDGTAPFMNSQHPGIVVVSFCDGRVTTLSEDIDYVVYCSLVTPDGTKIRSGVTLEDPVNSNDF